MLKLVKTEFKIDEKSFSPELEVTVRVPLEQNMDQRATDPNFYEAVGRSFMNLLEEKSQ